MECLFHLIITLYHAIEVVLTKETIMSDKVELPSKIFNLNKTDYEKPEIILGQDDGIFDSINKRYPELWKLYKSQKSLDWDENEFDYTSCNVQFKTCDKHVYDMMIKNLAWQWEADTVASKIFVSVLSNVCTSPEAWSGWQCISDNEVVHALTYSEIVRNSFDDPSDILDEILKVREAHSRLVTVGTAFHEAKIASGQYGLGLIPNDQDLYNKIYKFIVAILCMERIQFMASFAVTFGIAESTGLFMPAAKAIQKIAQDEFEIHVQYGKAVLKELFKTERGKQAFIDTKDDIVKMINEVIQSEVEWTEYAFSEGRELTGVTCDMMKDWVYFSGTDVAKFFGLEDEMNFPMVETNPLGYMKNWLSMDKVQASNQEENTAQYKVNVLSRDDAGEVFDIDL